MRTIHRAVRKGAAALALLTVIAACQSTGGLGGILGDIFGSGDDLVSGSIRAVDTRSQIITIEQSNRQAVSLTYDNRTQVVYQNQNFPVTSLEVGDEVTARIASTTNNIGYTDLITVTRSVSGSPGQGNVQTFEGTVRQIDQTSGWFTISTSGSGILTVSMPYNPRLNDVTRFQNLRTGDFVRFYGVFINNTRVELREFR